MGRSEARISPHEIERAAGGGGVSGATGYRTFAGCAVAGSVLVAGVVRDWKIRDRVVHHPDHAAQTIFDIGRRVWKLAGSSPRW